MLLLAYCITEAPGAVREPISGVGGKAVEELSDAGLSCFFSRFDRREEISRIPPVESALIFHRVLQAFFRHAALVPFRFPTLVEDEENLRRYLREHAVEHKEALARLRNMVQMEVRIAGAEEANAKSRAASGREYLAAKQARASDLAGAAQKYREATRKWVVDWRERHSREGIRCYALVPRDAVASFKQSAAALSGSTAEVRVSGPWPPTEFLELVKDS